MKLSKNNEISENKVYCSELFMIILYKFKKKKL